MKSVTKKRHTKSALKKAKDNAWREFSIFIRTRDCIRTTTDRTIGACCTCDLLYDFKVLQAGHFIAGRNNAVLFQERGVHGQCPGCNLNPPRGKGGNTVKYWLFMEKHYGREVIDELIAESHQTVIYKTSDYIAIAEKYRQKTAELLANPYLAKLDSPLNDL